MVEPRERGRQVQLGLSRAHGLPAGVAECGKSDAPITARETPSQCAGSGLSPRVSGPH